MTRYDFQILSAVGAVIATFDSQPLALKWAKANRETYPGMTVEIVTTTTRREVIYRPRVKSHLRVAA